jgi:2'-5' RNA ligase
VKYIWLRPEPEGPLVGLHEALWAVAWEGETPRLPWCCFRPHLSIGQVRGRVVMIRLLDQLRRAWQPVQFPVDQVSLMRQGDPPEDAFRVANQLPLGGPR